MPKRVMVVVTLAVLSTPVIAAAAGKRHIHFTSRVIGAGITAAQAAFKVHDSHFGNGAGVQTVTVKGAGGTDTEITYYGDATIRSRGTFKLGKPDANGISQVTGSGHDIGGTGRAKGVRSTYTYSGTFNTKTGVFNVKLTGTYTL